jgi:ElaB/YqjD/DUF883 family membrane-anchored ribosome-binding protein
VTTTVLERTTEQIADTVEKASRATTKMGNVLQERYESARSMAKRGAHAAEEIADETRQQIKRRPVESITVTFLIGVLTGTLLGWMLRRK